MTRTTIPARDVRPGMTLDTMAGPVRVVGTVTDDEDFFVTIVARPIGRAGACTEQVWTTGTLIRVLR